MSSIIQANQEEKEKAIKNIKATMGEKIEATKSSIIDKLNYLHNLNTKLKNDFVPSIVINNLNQSIKDVEVFNF
jgi:hypothetical protein